MRSRYSDRIKIIKTPTKPQEVIEEPEPVEDYDSLFDTSLSSDKGEVEEGEPETMDELEMRLVDDQLAVLYFYTDWCIPCQKFSDVWNKISSSHPDVTFIKVDKDSADELVSEYGVKKLPTFVFIKSKNNKIKKLSTVSGSSKADVEKNIKKHK